LLCCKEVFKKRFHDAKIQSLVLCLHIQRMVDI
jgi:hypothetical protein